MRPSIVPWLMNRVTNTGSYHPTRNGLVATAGGLSVSVGYAEDKEIETPDPAAFPVPWAGAPNTTFLGGTVPGQAACGTLAACYDAVHEREEGRSAAAVAEAFHHVENRLRHRKMFGEALRYRKCPKFRFVGRRGADGNAWR